MSFYLIPILFDMNSVETILHVIRDWFSTVQVDQKIKDAAIVWIKKRYTSPVYAEYTHSIDYLIENKQRDLLIDCFYRTIPFGTWWRRGKVWIGPNRINEATLMESAQWHSIYLKETYPQTYMQWVALAYDVRVYTGDEYWPDSPVIWLSWAYLAEKIATVYAAHDIPVFIFTWVASTPELAYIVRSLGAISWVVISASHNPPEYNWKKVYDQTWCQLIPPHDEQLIIYVDDVTVVDVIPFDVGISRWTIRYITEEEREKYISYVVSMSLGSYRSAKVYFSPLHGTTYTSVLPVLDQAWFNTIMDPTTWKVDPTFSWVIFNIPDPEVIKVYDGLLSPATAAWADIILTTDPDGDRIGCMSKEINWRHFFNGNEIAILCSAYVLSERKNKWLLSSDHVMAKTMVTSDLLYDLAQEYVVQIVWDLLVGFKYIWNEVNKLAEQGKEDLFLLWGEESHGISVGTMRDKWSACAALLLSELASRCKDQLQTLWQYLNNLYSQFWYYHNYLTEIRLPGAEWMSQIQSIMNSCRDSFPKNIWWYTVISIKDMQSWEPFLSESDKKSRNVLLVTLEWDEHIKNISFVIRPSGTEPKIKFYFQVWGHPHDIQYLAHEKERCQTCVARLEKALLWEAYKRIGVEFPERWFLLFNKMPLDKKLYYFEKEEEIAWLKDEASKQQKEIKLNQLLSPFGANPIQKVEKAFIAKYGMGIREWVGE